jgi:hypothetical protein
MSCDGTTKEQREDCEAVTATYITEIPPAELTIAIA